MYKQTESYFKGYQEISLFFQTWEVENPKGHLIITHGQGEHSDCYQRLAHGIEVSGWNICSWDLRGHGRSEGIRGFASHFDDYVMDYEILMTSLFKRYQETKLPIVVLAHSMGALIHLKALVDHKEWPLKGQILSSPMMGLALPVPKYKQIGAKVLEQLLPKVTLWNELTNEHLSKDPQVLQEYERDVLRHSRISAGVYLGSLKAMEYVFSRADKIQIPTLFQLPENDPVTSTKANKELFKLIHFKEKKMKLYKDRKHEIYNDLGREEAYSHILDFLNSLHLQVSKEQ